MDILCRNFHEGKLIYLINFLRKRTRNASTNAADAKRSCYGTDHSKSDDGPAGADDATRADAAASSSSPKSDVTARWAAYDADGSWNATDVE